VPKVDQDLSARPVDARDPQTLWYYVNRELTPLVRALRKAVNGFSYEREFTASDVVAGGLQVVHNLDSDILHVVFRDGNNLLRLCEDSTVEIVDDNTIDVDVSLFSITGTWKILVSRG
jgi:hypothetical protein